jgi:uncharacterized protein (TIGR00369 family)
VSAPADLDAVVRDVIVASPLGRLLGVELVSVARDRVDVRLPFRPEVTTVGDLVHGGAIGALVDVTATAAAWSDVDLGRGPRGTTIGLTINYLNGARGCDLVATGTIAQRGKSIVVCEVTVDDDTGTTIARALVTYKLGYREGTPDG